MYKVITLLGRFVVKMYRVEAKGLLKKAEAERKLQYKLEAEASKLASSVTVNINEASSIASKAESLSKFF